VAVSLYFEKWDCTSVLAACLPGAPCAPAGAGSGRIDTCSGIAGSGAGSAGLTKHPLVLEALTRRLVQAAGKKRGILALGFASKGRSYVTELRRSSMRAQTACDAVGASAEVPCKPLGCGVEFSADASLEPRYQQRVDLYVVEYGDHGAEWVITADGGRGPVPACPGP
jgi:hypothetical protein